MSERKQSEQWRRNARDRQTNVILTQTLANETWLWRTILKRNAALLTWFGLILIGGSVPARSQTETVLYSFPSSPTDGFQPAGGLLLDGSGNLFGTTVSGSETLCDLGEVFGCGIVYELVKSSNGYKEKILYSFGTSSPNSDGASPQAGLIMDTAGNLYGTTTYGGYGGSPVCLTDVGVDGCGTVFELVKSSSVYTEHLLYTFMGTDGAYPYAGLTTDSPGNLYGTTYSGGACGLGTVFELANSSGAYTEKVLHSFGCSSTDGRDPYAGLIMDSAGNLYGTTESDGISGNGIVFELVNSDGDYTENVLYSFSDTDGRLPSGNLISDSSGNLYGTTEEGGEYGDGTVFELMNSVGSYSEKVLYSFEGPDYDDGQTPVPGLVMDASGNLYGTTQLGGTSCDSQGCGTIFELVNSSGTYTEKVLHRFGAAGDGEVPTAPLVMDSAGSLYGTTDSGGTNNSGGTVFLVNPTATAPAAILSLLSLTFGNQPVDVISPPQSVTVTNSGSANLIFGSGAVTVSGANAMDFTINANTCTGTAIAPGATCSINVAFTPSIVGTESAALNFDDNASTSPQTVSLSGSGVTAPPVTLSPSGLVFSSQPTGTTGTAQTVSLTNKGGSPLTITGITVNAVSASFSETNNCGPSLAVGGNCMVQVVFAPTAVGLQTGTLSVADNAPNSPQTASLAGTGTAPVASVSPASLAFSGLIGATSVAQTATVSNVGNADLTISSLTISGANAGDFAIVSSGTTCAANGTVMAGSGCAVSVIFTPTAGGTRSAILTITDNSYDQTTQNVPLSGTGGDFGVAVSSGTSSSATVAPGGTASYTVSISPEGGFDQTVNISCAGAPPKATCLVSPDSVLLNGSSVSAATVTVTTTAASATSFYAWRNEGDNRLGVQFDWPRIWLPVGSLGLWVVIVEASLRRRWRMNPPLRRAMWVTILASQTMLTSCGGGSGGGGSSPPQNPGTPSGSYTLTVSGTSGNLSHSTILTLTVD